MCPNRLTEMLDQHEELEHIAELKKGEGRGEIPRCQKGRNSKDLSSCWHQGSLGGYWPTETEDLILSLFLGRAGSKALFRAKILKRAAQYMKRELEKLDSYAQTSIREACHQPCSQCRERGSYENQSSRLVPCGDTESKFILLAQFHNPSQNISICTHPGHLLNWKSDWKKLSEGYTGGPLRTIYVTSSESIII